MIRKNKQTFIIYKIILNLNPPSMTLFGIIHTVFYSSVQNCSARIFLAVRVHSSGSPHSAKAGKFKWEQRNQIIVISIVIINTLIWSIFEKKNMLKIFRDRWGQRGSLWVKNAKFGSEALIMTIKIIFHLRSVTSFEVNGLSWEGWAEKKKWKKK